MILLVPGLLSMISGYNSFKMTLQFGIEMNGSLGSH